MTLPAKNDLVAVTITTQTYRDALGLLYDHIESLPVAGTSYTVAQSDALFLKLSAGGTLAGNLTLGLADPTLTFIDTSGGTNAKRALVRMAGDVFEIVALDDSGVEQGPILSSERNASGQAARLNLYYNGTLAATLAPAGTTVSLGTDLMTSDKVAAAYAPLPTVIPIAGTSHTFTEFDLGRTLATQSGSATTLTIPTAAQEDMTEYVTGRIFREGAGSVTITAPTGVTLNGVSAGSKTVSAQYGTATYYKKTDTAWFVGGDIA